MKLAINDKRKISALQQEFSKAFPFLRLEFFSLNNKTENSMMRKALLIPNHKTIGQCRQMHKNGSIIITPRMKVSQLEKTFFDDFGLVVQVFRESGRVWLETTLTDDWTLAEQNKQGEELSSHK